MPKSGIPCPLCASLRRRPVGGGLYLCLSCGAAFNAEYRPSSYGSGYFLDDYKSQYGKTYEQDYDAIYRSACNRLDKIFSLAGISRGGNEGTISPRGKKAPDLSLLDVGSALGFFLKCAKDRGIGRTLGIEISRYASNFCKNRFGIDVVNAPFPDAEINGTYDIVTAWYFIEHLEDPVSALLNIHRMINPGGVFAFSSPSVFGPLYLCDRKKWIGTHPPDHRIDFSPSSARKFLTKAGFKKIHICPGGFHPERIFPRDSVMFRPFSVIYGIFTELTSFSDTIEVYAVK